MSISLNKLRNIDSLPTYPISMYGNNNVRKNALVDTEEEIDIGEFENLKQGDIIKVKNYPSCDCDFCREIAGKKVEIIDIFNDDTNLTVSFKGQSRLLLKNDIKRVVKKENYFSDELFKL